MKLAKCLCGVKYNHAFPISDATDRIFFDDLALSCGFTTPEVNQMLEWSENRYNGLVSGCHLSCSVHSALVSIQSLQTIPVQDVKVRQLINWTNALSTGTELNLDVDNHAWKYKLVPLVQHLRERYLSRHHFSE